MKYNTGESSEDLKAKYNPEGSNLRIAQLRMMDMLIFLDKICKKNNIEYFIFCGTLLGAYRHGGFIPWDDDLDVFMSVSDSIRFKKIVDSMQECDYVIQCHESDPGFVRMWNVLRDKNSEYIKDDPIHNARRYRGIQLDIFTYEDKVIKLGRRIIHILTAFNEKHLLLNHPLLSKVLFALEKSGLIPLFRLFQNVKRRNGKVFLSYESFFLEEYTSDYIFPLGEIEFEGYHFPCPRNVEAALREMFGEDFMNIPSESERVKHQVSCINFYDSHDRE